MYIVNNYTLAVIFCVVTMICWGSWGNTQKLAAKAWRYEYFYWDYVIGLLLFSILSAFTLGSVGSEGRSFLPDLAQADALVRRAEQLLVDAADLGGLAQQVAVVVRYAQRV